MIAKQAATLLQEQDNILILTHRRPDGDTVGCARALCLSLRQVGKTAYVLDNEDATALIGAYLDGVKAPQQWKADFVVSVDIAGESLFPTSAEGWKGKVDLSVDHHPSNEGFAKVNCVDDTCAACGELMYDICRELGPVTPEIALPLYVAVSTDTGCFVYGNTTARTHRVAADLIETGIDYRDANKRHFRTKSAKRLKLEAILMSGVELLQEGTLAIGSLSLADMASIGATEDDAEDIAAFIGQIEGVYNSVTIRELKPGECKLSVRTNPVKLNATKVCALLGGGGHVSASGCTVHGSVQEARERILQAIIQVQTENQKIQKR